jgi:hypothetical protein
VQQLQQLKQLPCLRFQLFRLKNKKVAKDFLDTKK